MHLGWGQPVFCHARDLPLIKPPPERIYIILNTHRDPDRPIESHSQEYRGWSRGDAATLDRDKHHIVSFISNRHTAKKEIFNKCITTLLNTATTTSSSSSSTIIYPGQEHVASIQCCTIDLSSKGDLFWKQEHHGNPFKAHPQSLLDIFEQIHSLWKDVCILWWNTFFILLELNNSPRLAPIIHPLVQKPPHTVHETCVIV